MQAGLSTGQETLNAYALHIRATPRTHATMAREVVVITSSIEAQPNSDVVLKLDYEKCLLKELNWIRGDEIQRLSINNRMRLLAFPKRKLNASAASLAQSGLIQWCSGEQLHSGFFMPASRP